MQADAQAKPAIMRRLICLLALLVSPLAALCADGAQQRPNIIFILVDDAGYGDLGCYAQTKFTTPQLDRMATEGMKFTRHYAGSTVCAPSRCALMTGLHTGHCRVRGNGPGFIPDTDLTVPKLLKSAGYTTACIGKYGLGSPLPLDDPNRKGFDYFFGYVGTAHAHNGYTPFLVRDGKRVPLDNEIIPGSGRKIEGGGVATRDGRRQWAPQLLADDVQRWLDERGKNANQPFFLYYALNLPHANNEAGKNSPLGHGLESPGYGEFAGRDWPDVEKGFASHMRFIDDQVGAVLAKLKTLGLDERTIVFFSSDNGPHEEGLHQVAFFQSNGGLTGRKRDLTEGGLRVPFIARWPGRIKAGQVSQHISGFQDFMPTAAELAGTQVTASCDGISFVPELLGRNSEQKQHPYLYWNFMEQGGKRSVLQWPWKLIHLNTGGGDAGPREGATNQASVATSATVQLYNLEKDPREQANVAGAHPEIVRQLAQLMREAWRAPQL
jgi:arylsulfatase A-like enzyme